MAPRKFYCHFCDVRLPHTRDARHRHFSGQNHVKNRNSYYRMFQTATEKFESEKTKEKCKRFLSSSGCPYGDQCIYSHLDNQDLQILSADAQNEQLVEEFGPLPCPQILTLASSDDIQSLILNKMVQKKQEDIMALLGVKC